MNNVYKASSLSVPSLPGENVGKVCENSRVVKNPRLYLGFAVICSEMLPNVRFGLHQAMKARKNVIKLLSELTKSKMVYEVRMASFFSFIKM